MLTDCALCDMLFDSRFWGFSEIPYPPNRNEQAQSEADAQQDVRIHFKSSKYRCAPARPSAVSATYRNYANVSRYCFDVACLSTAPCALQAVTKYYLHFLSERMAGSSLPKPKVTPSLRWVALWEPSLANNPFHKTGKNQKANPTAAIKAPLITSP